jgi:hypothetical protein
MHFGKGCVHGKYRVVSFLISKTDGRNLLVVVRTFFSSMCEHMSSSERMTSKSRLGLPARFELDQFEMQSKISGKIKVSSFSNWMV